MTIATTILIAVSLALDAFAVSIASGLTLARPRLREASTIAISFGAFQFGMPIIGWSAGLGLSYMISGIDHWIAFLLLALIGGRMIYESRRVESKGIDALSPHSLLLLSIATSIDALAVGISIPFVEISIIAAAAAIGVTTFSLSFVGVYLGAKVGHLIEEGIEIAGGLILISIGAKILIEGLLR